MGVIQVPVLITKWDSFSLGNLRSSGTFRTVILRKNSVLLSHLTIWFNVPYLVMIDD